MMLPRTKLSSVGKNLNQPLLEHSSDGHLHKYRGVLDKKVNFTQTIRIFRTNNHAVATYEQVRKRLSYFHQKEM